MAIEVPMKGQTVTGSTPPDLTGLTAILKVLSDPTRLRIFERLMHGVQCNCEIGDDLDLPMNLISHHLRSLREAGLVRAERDPVDRRWIYYSVDPQALVRLRGMLWAFFDPERIRARLSTCGPRVGRASAPPP